VSGARARASDAALYAALALAVVFALLPIAWGVSTSFKTSAAVHAVPPRWWPADPTLANWADAVFDRRFLRYLANTVLVVLGTLAVSLAIGAHAAYAVTRYAFRGRDALLLLIWATIMIPGISIVVPLYAVAVDVGLYDTLAALVIVFSAWLVPTLVWLLRGFVAGVPVELEESARIDGCSRLGAFYRITVPLMRPGLLAGGVLVFVMIWNEFLIAYSLTLSDENRLIQVGVYAYMTETGIEYGPLTAAAIGSILPVAAAFALMQRTFIRGLTGGAVKG
jgi:ABC-type glycerol-3-phosphate transport system permease component